MHVEVGEDLPTGIDSSAPTRLSCRFGKVDDDWVMLHLPHALCRPRVPGLISVVISPTSGQNLDVLTRRRHGRAEGVSDLADVDKYLLLQQLQDSRDLPTRGPRDMIHARFELDV